MTMDLFDKPFSIVFCKELLKYNFTPTDIKNHGQEILEQLWYEFSINNVKIVSVENGLYKDIELIENEEKITELLKNRRIGWKENTEG